MSTRTTPGGATMTWMAVALISHLAWGAHPVFSRYLQTIAGLPSFVLLSAGAVAPTVAALVWLWRDPPERRLLLRPMLWALAVIVVARSVTNLIAPRFTLAIYVQLIILMTPFEVVLLGRMFFGERVPHGTYSAITLSLLGALLMMSGEDLRVRLTALDLLGIGLALFSSICLALYMLIVRRAATRDVPPRVVFAVHNGAIFGCTLLMSVLLREPWTGWRSLSPTGWLIFAALSGGVFLGGNLGQIGSIGRLGAAPVSALMASRLLATLAVGALVLNERPETPLQWFGALIVMMTISWYLWRQYRAAGEDASIKA